MLIPADSLPDGVVMRCDVAIVGAGPAGLSVAAELASRLCRVLLLEAGSTSPSGRKHRHLNGQSSAVPFPIASSRDRGFGGTSRLWRTDTELRLRQLDPVDFESLAARAGQAWPFRADELEPYYRRARSRLGVKDPYPDATWLPAGDAPQTGADDPQLAMFHFADFDVFLRRYRDVATSPWIELVSPAAVHTVDISPDTGQVTGLHVISSRQSHVRIEARRFVLACGTIENARLLLDSPGLTGRGVGNEHDQVGRWFMDHPSIDTGVVVSNTPGGLDTALFSKQVSASGAKYQRMLWVGESAIRRHNLLNAAFWVYEAEPAYLSPGVESARALSQGLRLTPRLPQGGAHLARMLRGSADVAGYALARAGLPRGKPAVVLRALTEQIPDPSSRITLSERRDPLHRRQVTVNWRVSIEEVQQLRGHQALLAEYLQRRRLGTIIDRLPADESLPMFWSNHHHLGGTRMHVNPKLGVVDADCRVHSAPNLFVTGGSVFPTGGYVNPTLTMVALAIRTADVIRRGL